MSSHNYSNILLDSKRLSLRRPRSLLQTRMLLPISKVLPTHMLERAINPILYEGDPGSAAQRRSTKADAPTNPLCHLRPTRPWQVMPVGMTLKNQPTSLSPTQWGGL